MNQTMSRIRPFLLNLPSEIIINILARLPIRTILSCKCVCKPLLNLLSTPDFAESHLPLSIPGLLFLQSGTNRNLCHIFEFEDGYELQNDNLNISTPAMKFDPNVSLGLPDVDLMIVGSVNGLLCLRENEDKGYDALYVCNPITREYIALPRIEDRISEEYVESCEYGFGVSKITGQYKVVRNHHWHSKTEPCSSVRNYECLVYTVGTRSWRNVQPGPPFGHYDLSFSLFLNGNLHATVHDTDHSFHSDDKSISCFDLESELFTPFPRLPPPPVPPIVGTLGILDDCLCFFDIISEDEEISAIWVMKEYGVEKSWSKLVVLVGDEEQEESMSCTYSDSVCPIKAFKNGDILLIWNDNNLLYYSSKTKACRNMDFMIEKEAGWIEAIPHTLSFLSLKSFHGENVISFSC